MTAAQLYDRGRHLHRHPLVIAWAATALGRATVVATTAALLMRHDVWTALEVAILAAIVQARPTWRNAALSLAGATVLYRVAADKQASYLDVARVGTSLLPLGASVVWAGLLYLGFRAARRFGSLPGVVRTHPQVALHALLWAVLAGAWFIPAHAEGLAGVLRLTAACFPFFIWRCGYLLQTGQRGTAAATAFHDHVPYLLPAWGGSSTPYGKGYDALREASGDTAAAVAASQLAGLKLLGLAWIWKGVQVSVAAAAYGHTGLGLSSIAQLIAAGPGATATVAGAWAGVIVELVLRVCSLASAGHFVIGALRLCGVYAFRNTYKPLLSESLVDFWNRYYYYFKELMVEFFFYPTYLTWFRSRPALRLYAAVFASACLGNTYYHVLSTLPQLAAAGPAGAARLMAPRVFYTVLLAAGVCLSMRRQRTLRGVDRAPATRLVRLRRIAGVWLFFALINIWNVTPLNLSFSARSAFFLSLFGWR